MSVRIAARRLEGFAHEIDIEGGHTLVVDEPTAIGGTDTGPSPGRLLAASLAACTAVTMEIYAERKGWDIGAVEVEVDATYDEGGHIAKAYELTVTLPGGLDEDQRERLFKVAAKCPIHKVLSGDASIEISDRLADPA
ncbi:MAG TPA: OsmC family protein [Solirubrobacterales bacterium]